MDEIISQLLVLDSSSSFGRCVYYKILNQYAIETVSVSAAYKLKTG